MAVLIYGVIFLMAISVMMYRSYLDVKQNH